MCAWCYFARKTLSVNSRFISNLAEPRIQNRTDHLTVLCGKCSLEGWQCNWVNVTVRTKREFLLYTRISGEGGRVLYHGLVEVTCLLLSLFVGFIVQAEPIAGYSGRWVSVLLSSKIYCAICLS